MVTRMNGLIFGIRIDPKPVLEPLEILTPKETLKTLAKSLLFRPKQSNTEEQRAEKNLHQRVVDHGFRRFSRGSTVCRGGRGRNVGHKAGEARERECELRIEVSPDSPLRLRLLASTAEIFGNEIAPEIWLSFPPGLKFAFHVLGFSWYGATIEMDGATETDYTADEGPRVIVVGSTDSGKSTLSRMLLSWAAKQGWKPTFVDLDIGQGSITIPGLLRSPNVDLYKVLVKELAQILERQFAGNAESRAVGMVINTMGWIENIGYELLLHSIDALKANVLVLGEEKLFSMLKDVLKSKPNVDVVKLQKSGGVVTRQGNVRKKARHYRIKEYLYGLSNDFSPHSNTANFSYLSIYRVGGGPQAPRSALPIGAEPAADPTKLVHVTISKDMHHAVLAVSFAKEPDQIISSNVAGFICITEIDFDRKKITYLAPSTGELPGRFLIMGSLAWLET
ncbi:hypothetical protein RHGRI_028412 [Rhododendron griersonianum]|uniref:Protein CLP1 homolog n=1 Tax=Rhododendron griersonianum TaxID=479676 RepID=A0AAV6IFS0_9ERIC|nr:hypothetical protein RHGRI_028412 [Rhododendron griersonianum]